jgi:hypothetical protein
MVAARKISVAGAFCCALSGLLWTDHAEAQTVPPSAPRDENWEIVSNVSMIIGVSTVTLMPRIYYNDPEATVGWKARWHVSQLAPAFALLGATMLVDGPIKNLGEGTRPGCSVAETESGFSGSNCESYGMPSTHAFAAWNAAGAGLGIWVADTFVHSDTRFNVGSIIGNVAVPMLAGIMTSVGRGVGEDPFESAEQILVGFGVGLPIGFLTGIGYALLQEPNCGYGNNIICW